MASEEESTSSSSAGQQARVMMWCTPRSISTVFCKCMSFVPDSDIFYDPFVIAYFTERVMESNGKVIDYDADNLTKDDWRKAAWQFAEEEISDDMINFDLLQYPLIKAGFDNPDPSKKLIFSKATTPSLDKRHFQFLPEKSSNYKHSFLLRHPAKLFVSCKKAIYELLKELDKEGFTKSLEEFDLRCDVPEKYNVSDEIYTELWEIWKHVRENLDPNPVVMESDDLLADPAVMLPKYCKAVGIPYSDSLLTWDESPAITDKWKCGFMPIKDVNHTYIFIERAIHSSHFIPPPPVPAVHDLPDDVKELVEKSMPLYEEMTKYKLQR